MTEIELIEAVRQRVQDPDTGEEGRPLYDDSYYRQAIRRAVQWVNIRFGATYAYTMAGAPSGLEDIGTPFDYYVELRATVEMCFVRAGEGGSSRISDVESTREIEVPNLRLENQINTREGTSIWRRLAAQLMEELEGLIDLTPELLPEVGLALVSRMSTLTLRRTNRPLDDALPASTLAATVSGSSVRLSWTKVKSHRFWRYVLERSATEDFDAVSTVASIHDNHTATYRDTPGIGVWYYRVGVVNDNNLRSDSVVVDVEVV